MPLPASAVIGAFLSIILSDTKRWASARTRAGQFDGAALAGAPARSSPSLRLRAGGLPRAHAEKILSLYEPDVEVLKRGKAGAGVEFGNKLWGGGETRAGLIVDFALLREAEADTALVVPAVSAGASRGST